MLQAPKDVRERVSAFAVSRFYQRREFREALEDAMGSPAEQLEHEGRLFAFFVDQMRPLLTEEERRVIAELYYMTVPSTELSAFIVRDQNAVVLAFSIFMQTVPLIYAQWLAAAYDALYCKRADDLIHSVARLLQLAEYAITGGKPRLLQTEYPYKLFERPALNQEVQPLIMYALGVSKLFVFGHELGHFILGHLDRPTAWCRVTESSSLELLNTSQRDELAADSFGLQLLLRNSKLPSGALAAGLGTILSLFRVCEYAMTALVASDKHDPLEAPTHPDAATRMHMLREQLQPVGETLELFDNFWTVTSIVPAVAQAAFSSFQKPAG